MIVRDDYKTIYIQESDELLQQMNKNLLIFEKDYQNIEAINSIFRFAHTLKSMSASMNYHSISTLAHKMEDLLEQIRQKKITTNEKIIELLFNAFDNLDRMVSDIEKNSDSKRNIEPLLMSFDKVIKKEREGKEINVGELTSLTEDEESRVSEAKRKDFFIYQVSVTLAQSCELKGARAFIVMRNLESIGYIIKTFPQREAINEGNFPFNFGCLFASREERGVIERRVVDVLEVSAVSITPFLREESASDNSLDTGYPKIGAVGSIVDGGLRKITSVRIDISRLDKLMNLVEELSISQLKLINVSKQVKSDELFAISEEFVRLVDELQNEIMESRLVPVNHIFDRFPRLVRDLAKQEGKSVKFTITGDDVELDRTILDEIGDPLIHILRNAVDHGIENPDTRAKKGKESTGKIILSARRDKNHVIIEISDDGKGIEIEEIKRIAVEKNFISKNGLTTMSEDEILFLVTKHGFSTVSSNITEISGRGVGLDVAREKTEGMGGRLTIATKEGQGTTISMRFPITTAVFNALLINIGNGIYAIPVVNIVEISNIASEKIKTIDGRETLLKRGEIIPLFRIDRLFYGKREAKSDSFYVTVDENKNFKYAVIVESADKRYGIMAEKLIGQHEIVIKQLSKDLRTIRGFSGATILGDGSLALILDIESLIPNLSGYNDDFDKRI